MKLEEALENALYSSAREPERMLTLHHKEGWQSSFSPKDRMQGEIVVIGKDELVLDLETFYGCGPSVFSAARYIRENVLHWFGFDEGAMNDITKDQVMRWL